MSLYNRLKSDNARIISGDDMQDVVLYNASGASKTGKARVTSVGIDVNPQGLMFPTKKHSICFHISDFSTISVTPVTNENYKGWKAEFLNSEGGTVTGIFNNPLVDKTLGYVVATLTEIKAPAGN